MLVVDLVANPVLNFEDDVVWHPASSGLGLKDAPSILSENL